MQIDIKKHSELSIPFKAALENLFERPSRFTNK